MPDLSVIHLSREELPLAWALVRTSAPDLDLDEWQAVAEALIDGGGGVLGVTAPNRLLHGVATYEVIENPWFGRILRVGTLATFELTGRATARTLLTSTIGRLSADLGCAATATSPSRSPPPRTARAAC